MDTIRLTKNINNLHAVIGVIINNGENKLNTQMGMLNNINRPSGYEGLSETSSDAEKFDVVFKILQKSNSPVWLDYEKLYIAKIDQKVFDAKLQKTNLVKADITKMEPTYRLNDNGILFLDQYGSYSNFKKEVEEQLAIQKVKSEEKENLEMQKLRGEIDDLTNRLFDYDAIKSRSKRSDFLSVVAVLLTLLGLFLQWWFLKNGSK